MTKGQLRSVSEGRAKGPYERQGQCRQTRKQEKSRREVQVILYARSREPAAICPNAYMLYHFPDIYDLSRKVIWVLSSIRVSPFPRLITTENEGTSVPSFFIGKLQLPDIRTFPKAYVQAAAILRKGRASHDVKSCLRFPCGAADPRYMHTPISPASRAMSVDIMIFLIFYPHQGL